MRAQRTLPSAVLVAATLVGCDAALSVLESRDGGVAEVDGSAEAAAAIEGGANDAGDAGDAGDGWPGPPGTVVEVARDLIGAVDIDVDDAFVYVLIGDMDGGLWRVPKRGGKPAPVALHQTFPTSVRVTPRAVVWTVAPGRDPDAASVMMAPRDGGPPVPLVVGANNAGALAVDGDRVAWVDSGGTQLGRVMVAELDKGSTRPIVEGQLGVGGFALEGDRVVWTARCNASQCGGYVMTSSFSAPAAVPVWSTTTSAAMGGVALRAGTIGFAYTTPSGAFFGRLPPAATQPIGYPGDARVASPLRADGDFLVFLSVSGSSVRLTRAPADGTSGLQTLDTRPGSRGAAVPDAPAIYWISKEEGVLRAIAR